MKNKKHILVISQYFYPEQFRINDICNEWINRGYKVTVVTGIPNYPKGKFYDGYGYFKKCTENWNGIDIIRIPLIPRGNSAVQLALNYLSFVVSGFFWKLFTKIKPDEVFVYEVSPMSQALVGVWLAKRRKIPCYLYVMDLWPENFEYITGIHNKFVIEPINAMVRYIYKRCDKIFVSSRGFIKRVEEKCAVPEKIAYWPQYAEEFYVNKSIGEVSKESISIREENKFQILFAGNIGEAQGLNILVDAAVLLKEAGRQDVQFCLVGDGRYKETLMENVFENNVGEMFAFYPRVPAEMISDLFAQIDAGLICLSKSDVFSITLPAKTQTCLACGKPLVVSADGEIHDVIKESGCGVAACAGDAQDLVDKIIQMLCMSDEQLCQMSKNAVEYFKNNYDKKMVLDIMDKYLLSDVSQKAESKEEACV